MNKLMKKSVNLLIIIILLGSLVVGCSKDVESTDGDNNGAEKGINEELENKAKNTIEIFGTVEASKKKVITLQYPVKIKNVIISEGQQVGLNNNTIEVDLLGLEDKYNNLIKQIEINETEILKQQNIIDNLNNDFESRGSGLNNRSLPEIKAKQLSYDMALNAYEKAKTELTESEKLFEAGAMSEDSFNDNKEVILNLENTSVMEKLILDQCIASIEKELEGMKNELAQKEQYLTELNKQLDQLKLELNNLNKDLTNNTDINDSFIVSEFNEGIIEKVYCEEGQVINAGSPIVSLVDKSSIYIKGEVPEEFIGFVEEGATVNVIPVYDKTINYKGTVDEISQVGTNKNNEVIVFIDIKLDNLDENLKLNYNVNIEIER